MNKCCRPWLHLLVAIGVFTLLGYVVFLGQPFVQRGVRAPSGMSADGSVAFVGLRSTLTIRLPEDGPIPVAIVVGEDAEILDFCGPMEVFLNAFNSNGEPLFSPFVVGQTVEKIKVGGGMKIVPDYSFASAPVAKVVVLPAMADQAVTAEMLEYIRKSSDTADVTMSVCNGAFVLARTGLLTGKRVTCHHGSYFRFAGTFPDAQLVRGARYVDDGKYSSSGGIASGIDLALHVVERYAGEEVVLQVIENMEYQGDGWMNPMGNEKYAVLPTVKDGKPLCPLCLMEGDPSIKSSFQGNTYFFCHESEKAFFDQHRDVIDRFEKEDRARDKDNVP